MKKLRGLFVVVAVALQLEFLAAVRYYYSHKMFNDQLQQRAESDLTLVAIHYRVG